VECSACPQSVVYIEHGRVVILSRHQHRTHTNVFTAADLRKLAEILEAQGAACAKLEGEAA
jgi:hypothetical protein